jgi:hypothetical protein
MARRGRLNLVEVDEAGPVPGRHGSHRGWRQGGIVAVVPGRRLRPPVMLGQWWWRADLDPYV